VEVCAELRGGGGGGGSADFFFEKRDQGEAAGVLGCSVDGRGRTEMSTRWPSGIQKPRAAGPERVWPSTGEEKCQRWLKRIRRALNTAQRRGCLFPEKEAAGEQGENKLRTCDTSYTPAYDRKTNQKPARKS